jgi:hypothetical protein
LQEHLSFAGPIPEFSILVDRRVSVLSETSAVSLE